MNGIRIVLLALVLIAGSNISSAAEKEDLEKVRLEQLETFGAEGLIKPYEARDKAKVLLEKPLSEQSIPELKKMAKYTDDAAILFGMIVSEYESYYSENYRNEFLQKKLAPFHDRYVRLSNELLGYRNQCYFNIGKRLKEEGKEVEAFLFFRDAYRLSSFTVAKGDHKGMRFKAEQELKDLLGISDIQSYVYWRD